MGDSAGTSVFRVNEGSTACLKDLEDRVKDLEEEKKFQREVVFRWEFLLTRAITGMYTLMWVSVLEQQQRAQLVANHIYNTQNLRQLSFLHREYPNAETSLANRIWNSIPTTYSDALRLMVQKRAQYNQRRTILAHPRVTKADFMEYLEAVHKNDVEFLAPIRDLEVEDKWAVFGGRQLFDE